MYIHLLFECRMNKHEQEFIIHLELKRSNTLSFPPRLCACNQQFLIRNGLSLSHVYLANNNNFIRSQDPPVACLFACLSFLPIICFLTVSSLCFPPPLPVLTPYSLLLISPSNSLHPSP